MGGNKCLATDKWSCLFKGKWLPFRVGSLLTPSLAKKSTALAILKRGRSKGKPSLKCKDFLTSTAESKDKIKKSNPTIKFQKNLVQAPSLKTCI